MSDPDPVEGLHPGIRAVVRHRITQGVTDALGDLVAIDADTVSVQTRVGLVVIDRAKVVAAKQVPPRTPRRGARHQSISIDELERTMVEGWPPLETAEIGDWLLRAASGFTGRANSVLPLGSPGVPMSDAVARCESWYDERGLRRLFCLFGPTGFTVNDDPLGRELLSRGYEPFKDTSVLTTASESLPSEVSHATGARVRLESTLSSSWLDTLDAWHASETAVIDTVRKAVLSGSPDQLFASLEVEGAVIGVARVAFGHAWAGVSTLEVAADHRRTGVAMQLMGAVADASRARGIRHMYLQVAQANSAARGLYQRLGFSTHHEYRYLGGMAH